MAVAKVVSGNVVRRRRIQQLCGTEECESLLDSGEEYFKFVPNHRVRFADTVDGVW
jgi:hypothetical protein